jgi:hypothetical protein
MPRKAAAGSTEPRRSTRIKDLPKPAEPKKKAPAKPRTKKAKAEASDQVQEGDDKEESADKPKSRGKKRTAEEEKDAETNGADEGTEEPLSKKVRYTFIC